MKRTIITALLALVAMSSATAIRKIKNRVVAMLRCCDVALFGGFKASFFMLSFLNTPQHRNNATPQHYEKEKIEKCNN